MYCAGKAQAPWVARVFTNALGNQELVLAGAIADGLSGQAGMSLD